MRLQRIGARQREELAERGQVVIADARIFHDARRHRTDAAGKGHLVTRDGGEEFLDVEGCSGSRWYAASRRSGSR